MSFIYRVLESKRNIFGKISSPISFSSNVRRIEELFNNLKDNDLNWGQVNLWINNSRNLLQTWEISHYPYGLELKIYESLYRALISLNLEVLEKTANAEIEQHWQEKYESLERNFSEALNYWLIDDDRKSFYNNIAKMFNETVAEKKMNSVSYGNLTDEYIDFRNKYGC